MHAKKQGAKFTAALVSNPDLIDLADPNKINLVLSPHQLASEYIIPFVDNPSLLSLHHLHEREEKWAEIQIPQHLIGKKADCFELYSWFIACKRDNQLLAITADFTFQENDVCSLFIKDQNDHQILLKWLEAR